MSSDAQAIAALMDGWNRIESAVNAKFPQATDEQVYELTSALMKHSLGL